MVPVLRRGRIPACDAHSFHGRARDHLPESLTISLGSLLDAIGTITHEIKELDSLILDLIEHRYPEARLLQQIPGVGPLISLSFILTIGDPHRFRRSRNVGPWVGLTPKKRESGDSDPQLRIHRCGDAFLRRLLVVAARYILGPFGKDSDLRRYGLRLCERGGGNAKKRAAVAVARKLAVLLHRLWITGADYEPLKNSLIKEVA